MPRKKTKSLQRDIRPDRKYNSVLIQKTINKVMSGGKKTKAESLVYDALERVAKKTKKDAREAFEEAIENIAPHTEIKSRRIGGATYQIPFDVKGDRRTHLALMWLVSAAREKDGMPFSMAFSEEIMDAINETGGAFKKKEETHRMAEANKAFAHFARF